jgi:ribosomal protein S18 acetylase RimI-like enzyme
MVYDYEVARMKGEDIPDILIIADENGLAPWSAADYLEELKREDSVLLTIRSVRSQNIAGFIAMRLITNNNNPSSPASIDILNIAIAKKFKRNRLGTSLLNETIRIARQMAPTIIWLEVRCSNKTGIAFYEFHGFELTQLRKALYTAPPEDGWLMKLDVLAANIT